jgi:probable phosphoglycerate mutase
MGDQTHRPPGLILVKHGAPNIVPDQPRSSWTLSPEGRDAARRLAAKLAAYDPQALFASTEPKAAETAAVIGHALGLTAVFDDGFGEHRADEKPFGTEAEFRADVARLFAEPDALVMGEETGAAARSRFDTALQRAGALERTTVVVAHGRVITLWLSARLGLDPLPSWTRLGLAHAVMIRGDSYEFVAP